MSLRRHWQGLFWQNSHLIRRPLRALRLQLSLLRHRFRGWRTPDAVVPRVAPFLVRRAEPFPHPAILVTTKTSGTEVNSLVKAVPDTKEAGPGNTNPDALFCWTPDDEAKAWPPNHLEALLMAMAAEDLPMVIAGWSPPSSGKQPQASEALPAGVSAKLFRLPDNNSSTDLSSGIIARVLPHITDPALLPDAFASPSTGSYSGSVLSRTSGPYLVRSDLPGRSVLRSKVYPIDRRLARLPSVPGPPTVLFLLPFLAIGGAERLLFDLIRGWEHRFRMLVVTLDPHRAELGQTVDTCRRLTPWLFTLGDWLPRQAHFSALAYLIRRYEVATLFSWNGTVDFYDFAVDLKQRFPKLRIVNQLYNHHGGWIEHYSPRLCRAIDAHVAVNTRIARALEEEWEVKLGKIATIHHGVEVPPPLDPDEKKARRQRAREALGLPFDRPVVGTFIRLHAQKRPLDILELARRFSQRDVHFLLAGGGPLDADVDRELAQRPIPNLTRLPLQSDVEPLYDAIDLALMTSAYEGLPVFLLDALARAIPAVATAVGDIPLLFERGGGALVDHPGDIDGLEKAIAQMIDPERLRKEGERGHRTVLEQFGLETYRAHYERIVFGS